jgi:hypothetical protein
VAFGNQQGNYEVYHQLQIATEQRDETEDGFGEVHRKRHFRGVPVEQRDPGPVFGQQ